MTEAGMERTDYCLYKYCVEQWFFEQSCIIVCLLKYGQLLKNLYSLWKLIQRRNLCCVSANVQEKFGKEAPMTSVIQKFVKFFKTDQTRNMLDTGRTGH